ncbi:hypothetical protein BH09PSE1_BH09PSE1_22670 [soil metagenome]
MKLVACQLDVGGLIWVNPDYVTTVQRHGPGVVLMRFAAGQPQQVAQVKGEPQDVVARLLEAGDPAPFDRRQGSAAEGDVIPGLEDPKLDYVRSRLRGD